MSKRVPHLHSVHTIVYFIYSFFFHFIYQIKLGEWVNYFTFLN